MQHSEPGCSAERLASLGPAGVCQHAAQKWRHRISTQACQRHAQTCQRHVQTCQRHAGMPATCSHAMQPCHATAVHSAQRSPPAGLHRACASAAACRTGPTTLESNSPTAHLQCEPRRMRCRVQREAGMTVRGNQAVVLPCELVGEASLRPTHCSCHSRQATRAISHTQAFAQNAVAATRYSQPALFHTPKNFRPKRCSCH